MSAFQNETFDMIICHNVLEYIDDKAELRKCGHEITDSLTLFLKNAFEYYEVMIMGEKALLLKPMQRQTLYKMQNWKMQLCI